MAVPLYLDEDVTEHLIPLLQALGHDVTSAGRVGNKGLKDPYQLLIASRLNRALVTYNAGDFELLHVAWHAWSSVWKVTPPPHHTGILVIHSHKGTTPRDIANAIDDLIRTVPGLQGRIFEWFPQRGWSEIS